MMRNLSLVTLMVIILAPGTAAPAPVNPSPTAQEYSTHQAADCRQCHQRAGTQATGARAVDDSRCRSCHNRQLTRRDDPLGFHASTGTRSCLSCHSFHEPGTVNTTRGTITLDSLADLNLDHCISCHDGTPSLENLNRAHQAAASLYHEQAASLKDMSPSQACLNCHSNTSATTWQAAAGGDVLAFSEHATHPFGVTVSPGRGSYAHRIRKEIDARIPLFGGKIQCQTCHKLTSRQEDLIVAFPSTKDLCLGCHQFRDQPLVEKDDLMATMTAR